MSLSEQKTYNLTDKFLKYVTMFILLSKILILRYN